MFLHADNKYSDQTVQADFSLCGANMSDNMFSQGTHVAKSLKELNQGKNKNKACTNHRSK